MKSLLALAAAMPIAICASAAFAGNDSYTYSGTYQIKLTNDVFPNNTGYHGHGPNTTHCVQLADDGSIGWPHSGAALLDGQNYGQFSVIDGVIIIYIDTIGSGQEPADLTFTAKASNGVIAAKGAYDEIQGGYSYDAADAAFGAKGSC